ncbi:zinc metalloprotease [Lysobacter tyrosinilyticus]
MAKLPTEIRLFRVYGAPVIVHWSVALALPLAWLSNRQIADAIAAFLAYFAIILVHEIGHASVARRHGFAVFALRIYPLHGICLCERPFLESQRIALAWGGVAAQALLIVGGIAIAGIASLASMPLPSTLDTALMVWVVVNLMILLFNLWPVPPLDGATAWRVLPLIWKRWRNKSPSTPIRSQPRPQPSPTRDRKVVEFDRNRRNR